MIFEVSYPSAGIFYWSSGPLVPWSTGINYFIHLHKLHIISVVLSKLLLCFVCRPYIVHCTLQIPFRANSYKRPAIGNVMWCFFPGVFLGWQNIVAFGCSQAKRRDEVKCKYFVSSEKPGEQSSGHRGSVRIYWIVSVNVIAWGFPLPAVMHEADRCVISWAGWGILLIAMALERKRCDSLWTADHKSQNAAVIFLQIPKSGVNVLIIFDHKNQQQKPESDTLPPMDF